MHDADLAAGDRLRPRLRGPHAQDVAVSQSVSHHLPPQSQEIVLTLQKERNGPIHESWRPNLAADLKSVTPINYLHIHAHIAYTVPYVGL